MPDVAFPGVLPLPDGSHAPDPRPLIGHTLAGRYRVLEMLGVGSMGVVYRARQLAVDREVAVKILRVHHAGGAGGEANARFLREARTHSVLQSANTVQVLDFGTADGGELFLVMELLVGESLRQRLARLGRLPAVAAIETCRQALRSLAEAHTKGVVHRDLKPEHMLYAQVQGVAEEDEVLKVLDFGVAKMIGREGKNLGVLETHDGQILGTPRYMSPEQAQGRPVDARSDLYSLGVILYEMLTGRPPFEGADPVLVMAQHIKKPPTAPSVACPEARIAPALDDLVMRILAKDPAARPTSAGAMSDELATLLESGLTSVATGAQPAIAGLAVPASVPPPPLGQDPIEAETAPPAPSRLHGGLAFAAVISLGVFLGVVVFSLRGVGPPPAILVAPSPPAASAPVASDITPAGAEGAPVVPASPAASEAPSLPVVQIDTLRPATAPGSTPPRPRGRAVLDSSRQHPSPSTTPVAASAASAPSPSKPPPPKAPNSTTAPNYDYLE